MVQIWLSSECHEGEGSNPYPKLNAKKDAMTLTRLIGIVFPALSKVQQV